MYHGATGPRAIIEIAVVTACIVFGVFAYRKPIGRTRAMIFLIVAAVLITLVVFLLPDAVRIHHAVLVFPLPHLIIAAIAGLIWNSQRLPRTIALVAVAMVCLSGWRSITATQKLIRETGGRGR